ncbi:MAG TPA: DMT family transporter, partial [Pusillimonas sp.]
LSTGFWGALGHLLQIQAYRYAPASVLAPFIYLQIISAATLGWLIWGQFPDAFSWLGIAVICASGVTIGMVEWRNRKL